MKVQNIQFKGQDISVGDIVTAKMVPSHLWADDFENQEVTIVVLGIDSTGTIGGWSTSPTICGNPAYVALDDSSDNMFECTLISVVKPTKE